MELQKYGLEPQEQLAVSLYLKSMNKKQSALDAGYQSTSVFNKESVKLAIAEQLQIRAERLRLGGDWVLSELVRVYHTAMNDNIADGGLVAPPDLKAALKALDLIGKHVDIKAYDPKQTDTEFEQKIVERLTKARSRNTGGNEAVSFM
jgi:phage terminase small subunit